MGKRPLFGIRHYLSGSRDPQALFDTLEYKRNFRIEHPEYFDVDGITVFCGPQGSGKTLSAVSYLGRLGKRYPDMKLFTNTAIADYPYPEQITQYQGVKQFLDLLDSTNNGYAGAVFFLDEVSQLFNSLESLKIPLDLIVEICQQRKQRKHIVGTAQLFTRIAKPFREQFKYAVACKCLFGVIQYNTIIDAQHTFEGQDGKIIAAKAGRTLWFHTRKLYESYDTFHKIER